MPLLAIPSIKRDSPPLRGFMYKIVRCYKDRNCGPQTRRGFVGLTLEEARAHCSDPETSSSTCTKAVNKAHTAKHGAWFDGYESI